MIAFIGPILTLAVSLYYLVRSKQIDAVLLVTGSSINLVTSVFFIYLPYYIESRALPSTTMTNYLTVGAAISLIGTLIFVAGLFILINRIIQLALKSGNNKMY